MFVENPKYENFKEKVSGTKLFSSAEHCFPITKKNCLVLDGTVINEVYNSRIPNAKIFLFNKCTGETTEEMSDENGEFNFCLECGCEYDVIGQKINFGEGRADVTTIIPDCAQNIALGVDVPLSTVVKMKVSEPNIASIDNVVALNPNNGSGPIYVFATPNMLNGNMPFPKGMTPEELNRYFIGKDNPAYEEGQVIKLSNIYYDFDKSFIRKDAGLELDYVLQLLRTYPSMHISLMSHTDSRGNDGYNERLSKRRAERAMLYLVNKGVSPSRLTYEGLGEKQHVNDCEDGVDCDEMRHQLNRRTEIKITKFNNPNVRVEN
jgi:outer membrane protein OmpA-like peptidoglycan-associated protein